MKLLEPDDPQVRGWRNRSQSPTWWHDWQGELTLAGVFAVVLGATLAIGIVGPPLIWLFQGWAHFWLAP